MPQHRRAASQARTPESPTPTGRWPLFQWWGCTRTVQGGTLVLSEESWRLFMWNGNNRHWPTLCEWYSSWLSHSRHNLHIKNHKTELMVHRYTTVLGSVIMQNKVYGAGETRVRWDWRSYLDEFWNVSPTESIWIELILVDCYFQLLVFLLNVRERIFSI